MKKIMTAALLSASLLLSGMPAAMAASDISGHWAEKYITYLNKEQVMNPSASTGAYSPGAKVTRAEFMRYINRAFHFTETASISYADVKQSDWFYETVQVAAKYGYIAGVGDNKMDPGGYVTREQAATIIGRLYKTTKADNVKPAQLTFTDKAKVSAWSAGYIHEAVEKGYIVGYPDGTFLPKNTVTRAEIARILYSYLGNSLSKDGGSYTGVNFRNDVENVTISEAGTLSTADVGGDLYITEGLGSEKVVLSDVSVNGALIISGGTVTLENVEAPTVIIGSSMNRLVQVTAMGKTNIAHAEIQSTASLTETALDVSAGGFSDLAVNGNENTTLTLSSNVWDVDVNSNSSIALASSAQINTLNMKAAGKVTGYGAIGTANITANGSNIAMEPGEYKLASGITATINGKKVKSDTAVTVSPSTLKWDTSGASQLENSYDFEFSADPKTLDTVLFGSRALETGTDYRITEKGIRIYRTFLNTIKTEGTYTLELVFNDGGKARLQIAVTDTSKNVLSPEKATFDKYKGSAGYDDVNFTLTAASNAQLSAVKVSGANLARGEDYTYNAATGKVVIRAAYLSKRAAGEVTVSFTMSGGNDLSAQLTISDSTPANKLSETALDFDGNTASTDYEDLRVKLEAVDGAKLKSVLAVGVNKTLEEDWQYTVSSSGEVRINRSTVASFAEGGRKYVDLRFNMTSGVSPVLRVNYVTTYPVRVTVLDTDGQPVRDALLSLKPDASVSGNEAATQAQEKNTDSSGLATFYVKQGSYIAKVQGSRFETTSNTVRVSASSQNVSFKVAIQEEIAITVTDGLGAKVSGAAVTLGSQSKTTGADGTVTFNVERGSYTLSVSASGYQTQTETYKVANSIPKRIQLKR